MSKKTSEVEEIKVILEENGLQWKYDFTELLIQAILDWHTKAVAKEKMELVEEIEGMRKPTYHDPQIKGDIFCTCDSCLPFTKYNQALKEVLSALKSEEVGG